MSHHPLQRAEGLRPEHAGGGERLGGVQRGDPAAYLPAVHRRTWQVQRLRDLPQAGPARIPDRGRRPAAQQGCRALRGRDRQRRVPPPDRREGAGCFWR